MAEEMSKRSCFHSHQFTKLDIISNQNLIAQTFGKISKVISTNKECLDSQSEDYVVKTIEALEILWNMFQDNDTLLMEAEFQDEPYYTANIYSKVKNQFMFVLVTLPNLKRTSNRPSGAPSRRDSIISQQRINFKELYDMIKTINIDEVMSRTDIENYQDRLHRTWSPIDDSHLEIRQFYSLLPDVTYELEFMRYKNMYETTISLFNYKMDAISSSLYHTIPKIGIPTWRMFDENAKLSAFTVKSALWGVVKSLESLSDLNVKLIETEKRQWLITIFMATQRTGMVPFCREDFAKITLPQQIFATFYYNNALFKILLIRSFSFGNIFTWQNISDKDNNCGAYRYGNCYCLLPPADECQNRIDFMENIDNPWKTHIWGTCCKRKEYFFLDFRCCGCG